MNLRDKQGNVIPDGSIIRWQTFDDEDRITLKFMGLVVDHTLLSYPFTGTTQHVVYLGGGSDNGRAIGKIKSFEDVTETSVCNDDDEAGIDVVGRIEDLSRWIGQFGTG